MTFPCFHFSGLGNWMKLDFGGFMLVSTQFSVQTMFDTWFYPPPKDFVGLLRLQFALRGLEIFHLCATGPKPGNGTFSGKGTPEKIIGHWHYEMSMLALCAKCGFVHGFSKSRIPHTSHHLKSICHGFSFNFTILGCTRVPNFWTTQYVDGRIQGAVHLALVIVFFGRQSLGWVMGNGKPIDSGESFSLCSVVHLLLVKVTVLRLHLIFGEKSKCV